MSLDASDRFLLKSKFQGIDKKLDIIFQISVISHRAQLLIITAQMQEKLGLLDAAAVAMKELEVLNGSIHKLEQRFRGIKS